MPKSRKRSRSSERSSGASRSGWSPAGSIREFGRDGRERWGENGFRSLTRRQKVVSVIAVGLATALVASLLVATVQSVVAPSTATPRASSATDLRDEAPGVAAGVTMARLVSSERGLRTEAYIENVDPSISGELQRSVEPGVEQILEAGGAEGSGTLRTVPLGYVVEDNDGRLAGVRLWSRQEVTARGGEPEESFVVTNVLMRWSGERWLLYAYFGEEPGPEPDEVAADAYTRLPTGDAA